MVDLVFLAELAMLGTPAVRKLLEPDLVERAIALTEAAFPNIVVDASLRDWAGGEGFEAFLTEIKRGHRDVTDADVVAMMDAGFTLPDRKDTKAVAHDVLEAFLDNLVTTLYSQYGSVMLERRVTFLSKQSEETATERHDQVLGAIDRIERAQVPALTADNTRRLVGEEALNARVDGARDLLKEGKAVSAETALIRAFGNLDDPERSNEIKFRVLSNLGAARLAQDDAPGALSYLRRAAQLGVDRPKAFANFALASLLASNLIDADQWSAKALDLDPSNPQGIGVRVRVLHALERDDDIEQLVPDRDSERLEADVLLALGEVSLKNGAYGDAAHYFEKATSDENARAVALQWQAQALLMSVHEELSANPPLKWRLPEGVRARLGQAEDALDQAILVFEQYEVKVALDSCLADRGRARFLLGDIAGASSDYERVLMDDPDDPTALQGKALIMFDASSYADALPLLAKVGGDDPPRGLRVAMALCHLSTGHPEGARLILEPLWTPSAGSTELIEVGTLLLRTYWRLKKIDKVAEVKNDILLTWPTHPEALAAVAEQLVREGDPQQAIEKLQEALANASDEQRDLARLELAEAYYTLSSWAEAADLYADVADRASDTPTTRKYVVSLFNSGALADARAVASQVRDQNGPTPVITEVEAAVEESVGNLDRAIDLLLQLDEVEPGKPLHRLHAAVLALQRGRREQAAEIAASINRGDIWHDGRALAQLVHVKHLLGHKDVLPLAYHALHEAPDEPDVHLIYVQVFLAREDDVGLNMDAVSPGSTVNLESESSDEKLEFTILDAEVQRATENELDPDDDLAKLLAGKRVGDTLEPDVPGGVSYRVTNIRSKYVAAFQNTLLTFSIRFPAHGGLRRLVIKEDDLSDFVDLMQRQGEAEARALDLYLRGPLTIGALASAMGRTIIESWYELTMGRAAYLTASSGSVADSAAESQLAASADALVMDVTSLLALHQLGVLPQVRARFSRILMSQESLDEVNQLIAARFTGKRPTATLRHDADHLIATEVTQESFERDKQEFGDLREFIMVNCEITPCDRKLQFPPGEYEKLRDLLGDSSLTTVLLASEQNLPLCCEDASLRQLAQSAWGVRGFWSQSVLLGLRERGVLSREEYSRAVCALVLLRYRFVPIQADDLMWVLEENGMSATSGVLTVLSCLSGPDCSEESAARVAAELVQRLWIKQVPLHHRMLLLDSICLALVRGRARARAIRIFEQELRKRFIGMPEALPAILETVYYWLSRGRTS